MQQFNFRPADPTLMRDIRLAWVTQERMKLRTFVSMLLRRGLEGWKQEQRRRNV